MNDPAEPLRRLQAWTQAVITHPRGVVAGIAAPEARACLVDPETPVEELVLPSRRCTQVERLSVYSHAYSARLLECLRSDFPAVQALVGEETFDLFAMSYLQAHPPSSYTLSDLGGEFPAYLAATRPPRGETSPTDPDWADAVTELALLERTRAEVFDGPGEEGEPLLMPVDLAAIPEADRGEVRLRLARSLRLLPLSFAVERLASADATARPVPELAERGWLALFRVDWRVRHRRVGDLEARLLHEMKSGASIREALESASVQNTESLTDNVLAGWFQDWTTAGIIRGIQTGSPA